MNLLNGGFGVKRQGDIAYVGDESKRLADDEHDVVADDAIAHNGQRPDEAQHPKERRELGHAYPVGVVPLVGEAHGEDELPCRTKE